MAHYFLPFIHRSIVKDISVTKGRSCYDGQEFESLLESRLIPLALVAIRILVAAAILLKPSVPPFQPILPGALLNGLVLAWSVLALAAFFMNWPGTRRGHFLTLSVDLLFSGCILLLGSPVTAAMLPVMHGLAWRAYGGRGVISPTLPAYLALWAGFWTMVPDQARQWFRAHPDNFDPLQWSLILSLIVIVSWLDSQRRSEFSRLGDDILVDPVLATGQPFSYDFTKQAQQIANLYGRKKSDCVICLLSKAGALQVFSNVPMDRDRGGLVQAVKNAGDLLTGQLTPVAERGKRDAPLAREAAEKAPALLHFKRLVTLARQFSIGSQNGIVIIALDVPLDPILRQELAIVDRALDDVFERVSRIIEMRRSFLVEAREVARRDLHDGVLQSLAAIRMRLLTIQQNKQIAETPSAAEIRTTADIIALEQGRLRALLDRNLGDGAAVNLVETLRLCVATIALQWEVGIDFVTDEVAIPMQKESANNIEFLLREIVANATRHSDAKRISCTLAIRDSDLVISLIDASDPHAVPKGDGDRIHSPLESQSLKQRLTLVNGRAYFEGLKRGTLLAIAIPLVYEEND
jgi:hypothetical protein